MNVDRNGGINLIKQGSQVIIEGTLEEEVRDIFSIVATTALTVINYVHFIQVIFEWAAGHAHPTMDYLTESATYIIVFWYFEFVFIYCPFKVM